MPFISQNGQLVQVTQAQYDAYTAPTIAGSTTVPAGGSILVNDTTTTPILTSNTTNTSPNQTLLTQSAVALTPATTQTLQEQLNNVAIAEAGGTVAVPAPVTALDQAIANVDAAQANTSAVPVEQTLGAGEEVVPASEINTSATATDSGKTTQTFDDGSTLTTNEDGTTSATAAPEGALAGDDLAAAQGLAGIQGMVRDAQNQQTISVQRKQVNNGDWRVRLRLAPQANYLYKAPDAGIMQPLKVTDGVIFPYTPSIDTVYRANYQQVDLTHSNYRGYFYQNSAVDAVNLKATFTAQDTNEANYVLAVMTFFKSVTKMFYGQDSQRGAPPPLVFLTGLGQYEFNEHPCLVSQFQLSLPDNVDYIRARSPSQVGLNAVSIRDRQDVATNSIFNSINRLAAAFLSPGGESQSPGPPNLGLNNPTYVPTKLDINLTLLPVQTRQQVSQQFSLKGFANGKLITQGFW